MKIRYFFVIFALALLLCLVISPLRGPYLGDFGGFRLSSLVGFTAYLYLTMFCINRYGKALNTWLIFLALLTGLWLLILPIRIMSFYGSIISLPDSLLHTLGIICGVLYWQLKKPLNYAVLVLCCAATVFMYFQGYDHWVQKLNYGTFTGNVSYAQPAKFEAFDQNQRLISDADFNNKVVLLDFWHSQCGVCFQKFPYLQALHDKYKDDPSVLILAVDKLLEDDKPGQAFKMIEDRGYTFPVVIPKDEDMPEKFGVLTYPKTFIIANKGTVVFYGDIKFAGGKLAELRSSLR